MQNNKGMLYAAGAYVLWGLFPIYFKLIQQISAFQIVGHRIVWSFVLVLVLVLARKEFQTLKASVSWRTTLIYLAAGLLLTINWTTYVWAVNAGHIVEASLGYFINPLVSVLLGVFFLGEKLRPTQWIPVGLAAVGVVYLAVTIGTLPWIALVLALSFGLYGLIKKIAPLGSLHGLAMETGLVFLPALGFLLFEEVRGVGAFGHTGLGIGILLALTGIVTVVPLLLFSMGIQRIPLTLVGLLQYITPTLQFLLGVFLYSEPFTHHQLIGFVLIWLALVIFSSESLWSQRKLAASPAG